MSEVRKKTRAERRMELSRLSQMPGGRDKIMELFLAATGLPMGTMPAAGTLIFETILNKEFPNEEG